MRSDKMPAISPVDVDKLYHTLREFRRAVKQKYGELLKGWEVEIEGAVYTVYTVNAVREGGVDFRARRGR